MSTTWETFKKSLSSIRSKIKIGSSGNFNQEVKRMSETAKKNGDILDNEYKINYSKLKTFGKDVRITKVEKYINEHKKDVHKIKEVNEYFNFLKGKPYNEYIEDKFGGLTMKEFLRETVSSPIQFTELVGKNEPKDSKERTKITMEFWKYVDKCTSRAQQKIIEMAEFKNKVERLAKAATLEVNKIQKTNIIVGKANLQNPNLIKELTQKINKR